MTFIERFQNSFIQNLMQIIFHFFKMYQSQLINSYNYDIDNNAHIIDSFHMFQYPLGLSFPFSIPPNWVLLNSITSKPSQKINDKSIDSFLNKYKKNIYFSNGTIMKTFLSLNDYVEIFKYLKGKNIGVILSVREEQMNDNEKKLLPDNVYVSRWLDQNNLLGDNRINLFVITHGGYNSVLESVYHEKPMVVLGVGLDHYNVASFIKKRKIGEVFQRKNSINKDAIINSIENVLNDKEYSDNAIKIGKIMKDLKDPREEFKYWIDFGYNNGYSSLIIPSYKFKFSWIIVNGYDVALVWLLILLIIIFIIKKIIDCIHNCLCGKCENKHKRNKHYKFD
jgi:UDP:flavonoid glycosyltransferase YjiC (YdhE family)